jgi:hypothetical protein
LRKNRADRSTFGNLEYRQVTSVLVTDGRFGNTDTNTFDRVHDGHVEIAYGHDALL